MPHRAAIVTGASSGIGLGLAHMLGEEGHALTLNSRRPERLEAAVEELRARGHEVEAVPGSLTDEAVIRRVVDVHRKRFGRLDVLVNSAGVGVGQTLAELTAKALDLQLGANLRPIPLLYREALDLLTAAGAEHGNALVINMSSMLGKRGVGWLAVYAATKHGVLGYTESMNNELGGLGIKSTALCPAWVDTPMAEFMKQSLPAERMIQISDIVELVRPLLRLSAGCYVPEICFSQVGGEMTPPAT